MDSTSTPAEGSRIESLITKLNSVSPYDQFFAVSEIRRLAYINTHNCVAFARAGAIPLLTNLLTTSDSRKQEHAINSLFNLAFYEDIKDTIVLSGAVPAIVHVLREGSMKARENAAATLFSLSVIDGNRLTIAASGAIPPLVSLLSEGTPRGKKGAAIALRNLCLYPTNKLRALRAGVIPILVDLLKKSRGRFKDTLFSYLAILATHPEGNLAIGKEDVVPFLVEVIGNGSPSIKEDAATVLVELCSINKKYLVEAQQHGVMGNLTDLLQHGTDTGKSKARELLEKIEDQHHDHYPSHVEDVGVDRNQKGARFNISEGFPRSSSASGSGKYSRFNISEGTPGNSSGSVKSDHTTTLKSLWRSLWKSR